MISLKIEHAPSLFPPCLCSRFIILRWVHWISRPVIPTSTFADCKKVSGQVVSRRLSEELVSSVIAIKKPTRVLWFHQQFLHTRLDSFTRFRCFWKFRFLGRARRSQDGLMESRTCCRCRRADPPSPPPHLGWDPPPGLDPRTQAPLLGRTPPPRRSGITVMWRDLVMDGRGARPLRCDLFAFLQLECFVDCDTFLAYLCVRGLFVIFCMSSLVQIFSFQSIFELACRRTLKLWRWNQQDRGFIFLGDIGPTRKMCLLTMSW